MFEKIPHALGDALRYVRAGETNIAYHMPDFEGAPETVVIESDAFDDGGRLLEPHTTDGAGLSPPLRWHGAPVGTRCCCLIVEDPDAPAHDPFVHAIAWDLPAGGQLEEGAMSGDAEDVETGKNSRHHSNYAPPDPPPGHGPHRYVFQIFALSEPLGLRPNPDRKAVVHAMVGKVLAKGRLTGIYERQ